MTAPPPPAAPTSVRPSGWWYLATFGIAAVGLVAAVGLFVNGVRSARQVASEITSVEPGQSGLVTFEAGGDYTLYYAGPPRASVEADMRDLEREVGAELRPQSGGPAVPMAPYESASLGISDNADGQVVALSTFSIPAAGTYELRTNTIEGVSSFEARIVVGKSLYAPLARGAVLALAAIGLSAVLSVIASIALAVTRGRAKRSQALAWTRPSGPTPPWPGAPPEWTGPPPIIPPRPPGYGSGPDPGSR